MNNQSDAALRGHRIFLVPVLCVLLGLWLVSARALVPPIVRHLVAFGLAGVIMFVITSSPNFFRRFVGAATPGSLGAIRMLTCLVVLVTTMLEDLPSVAMLPPETRLPHGLMKLVYALPIGFERLVMSEAGLWVFQLATEVILFLGVLGWRTRIVIPLGAVCHFLLGGILRDYSFNWHQGWVPLYLLAILSFTPCGDGWSVDRLRRVYRGWPVPEADRASPVYGWSRYMCWVAIALPYVESGLAKLRYGGLSWFSPNNMRNILYTDTLAPREFNWQFSLYLVPTPDIVFTLLALASVISEVSFGLVLFSRLARRILPIAMVMMHIGIFALQRILFIDLILLQLAFLDFRGMRLTVGRRLAVSRGKIQVVYDGASPFWRRALRVLACLDLFGRLDWAHVGPSSAEPGGELRLIWRGRAYRGVAASRMIVRSIPALWVLAPLLYVPGFCALGTAICRHAPGRTGLPARPPGGTPRFSENPSASAVATGVERSARHWRFPLMVTGWVLVAMLCWLYRLEYYPLTSWHLFAGANTSGRITYKKVVARFESGETAPMRLEDGVGAMRFDARYSPFLAMCFGKRHLRRAIPHAEGIDLCRRFLMASGSTYNRKAPPGRRVTQLEVQDWEWDFSSHPLGPQYGRLVDRFVVDIAVERDR